MKREKRQSALRDERTRPDEAARFLRPCADASSIAFENMRPSKTSLYALDSVQDELNMLSSRNSVNWRSSRGFAHAMNRSKTSGAVGWGEEVGVQGTSIAGMASFVIGSVGS